MFQVAAAEANVPDPPPSAACGLEPSLLLLLASLALATRLRNIILLFADFLKTVIVDFKFSTLEKLLRIVFTHTNLFTFFPKQMCSEWGQNKFVDFFT